jgi:hypothetical protein
MFIVTRRARDLLGRVFVTAATSCSIPGKAWIVVTGSPHAASVTKQIGKGVERSAEAGCENDASER